MTEAEDYVRRAEEAERAASRTYNVVEYAEHLAAARAWRELAKRAAEQRPDED